MAKDTKKNSGNGLKKWKLVLIIIIIIAAAAFAFMYYYAYKYYKTHFYQGTTINGYDCSGMTADEAETLVESETGTYAFTFIDPNGTENTATATDFGISVEEGDAVKALLKKQDSRYWLVEMMSLESQSINGDYIVEKEKIKAWLESLPFMQECTKTQNAYAAQKENGYWEVVAEVNGNELDTDKTAEYIEQCIENGENSFSAVDNDCSIKATVFSDDEELAAEVKEKNKAVVKEKKIEAISKTPITLTIGTEDPVVTSLGTQAIKGMISEDSSGEPKVSEDKILDWLENWADDNGITNNKNLYQASTGEIVIVDEGNRSGWYIDFEATAKSFTEILNARVDSYEKDDDTQTTETTEEDFRLVLKSSKDGTLLSESTYVEIYIAGQQMKCYEDGVLKVDTPVVTGCVKNDTETPSNGVWYIYKKQRDHHMRGPQLADGSYEYETDVDFWLPFNDLIGIHDLADRVEFGGQIYIEGGSHGCVNTPYDAAKQIFEIVEVGTPVIVYG